MSKLACIVIASCVLCSACEKHMQGMYDQPRYKPLAASPLFDDGGASRAPPANTVIHSRDDFAGTSAGRIGVEAADLWDRDVHAALNPYAITTQLLARGQARFNIYCAPCHSEVGDGDGYIVRRGFPAPPSYHIERLRDASDRHFFDVITDGYGIMYSYASRVSSSDRWAIIAYIRALQLSQHAATTQLSTADVAQLTSAAP